MNGRLVIQTIRTPDQRLRVFVSSTLHELAEERAASKEAIQGIRLTPVMFEVGARPHPPRDLYRAYVAQSDVFIGIYWQRYGWIAPSETVSGLEDEYLLAQQLPKLIYIKRAEDRDDALTELLRRIQDDDEVSYRAFADAAELKDLIGNDLAIMLTERFAATNALTGPATPTATDAPSRSTAPVERGELVGRDADVERVTQLLQRPDTGLITLTGPGGAGKTRLAVHLAGAVGSTFRDGVFYVPLAGVRDADDVVATIASTLEIPAPPGGGDPETLLRGFLRVRHALLVLDNFEQILAAADEVAALLEICPHLKVLATSREPLHLRGEHEVPVPPLPHAYESGGRITPAMRLFEERAREVRPDFTIDDDNRAAVAELCRRVDALPLAIELAAARVRLLSPQAMLGRLQETLPLLSTSKRDLPERHQTLRATLEWSFDLLSPEERVFFRRLGVITGSFSEDAAAAVTAYCGLDALDGLTSLVEKSLLVRSEVRGDARFTMLETVREFARERVVEAGEERAACLNHGEWIVAFLTAEQANLTMVQTRPAAHERIVTEETGIRDVLRFAAGPDGDNELAWRLFVVFGFALMMGYARNTEVLATYELLEPRERSADPVQAALALGVWSSARANMFDPGAIADLEGVCAVLTEAGTPETLMCCLTSLGTMLAPDNLARSLEVLDRALKLARATGRTSVENWILLAICDALLYGGEVVEAQRYADEFAKIARLRGDDETVAYATAVNARIRAMWGDLDAAQRGFAEAAARAAAPSAGWIRAAALCGLASVTVAAGDEVRARAILEEAIVFCVGVGFVRIDVLCGALALALVNAGETDRAMRVFEAVAVGAEGETDFRASAADPSGALRAATRRARKLLGDPPGLGATNVDFDRVLEAALGSRADTHGFD